MNQHPIPEFDNVNPSSVETDHADFQSDTAQNAAAQNAAAQNDAPFSQPSDQPQVRDPDRFTGHRVRLRIFEGPLDLLLYLVRAHRYDIADLPLGEITAQFIEWLRLMDEVMDEVDVELEQAGDFLVTAATLMQIKSRMLLPQHQSANEDEIEDDSKNDPRRELVDRLLQLQQFQDAADNLRELRDERAQLWTRPPPAPDLASGMSTHAAGEASESVEESTLLQDISTFDLLRALQKVLDRQEERPVTLVRREPFSLNERVRDVWRRLNAHRDGLSFGALCDDCQTRLEIVITFLAVLEIIRRGRVIVSQRALFDEITLSAVTG